MNNEEKKIKRFLGKENHFLVPEGYFNTLADQIMAKIPDQEVASLEEKVGLFGQPPLARKMSLWQHLSLRKIAAGVAAVALLGCGVSFGLYKATLSNPSANHAGTGQMAHVEQIALHGTPTVNDDAEFEQMADYAMMDSQDIYASLIAEN